MHFHDFVKTAFSEPSKPYQAHLDFRDFVKNWFSEPSKPYQAHLDLEDSVKNCFSEPANPYQAYLDFEDSVKNNVFRSLPNLIRPIMQKSIAEIDPKTVSGGGSRHLKF